MPTEPLATPVVVDDHESRGLAVTILLGRDLLDHADLDADQHEQVRDSLDRAATRLARRVVHDTDAPDRPAAGFR